MNNKSYYNRRVSFTRVALLAALVTGSMLMLSQQARAGDAPGWMHALVNVPLPAHDDKTVAVLLYSDEVVTVQSENKVKTVAREAYKVLRPDGRGFGDVVIPFGPRTKITSLHGWCIPVQGKDYEVKDKDAIETSLRSILDSELFSDVKDKVIRIPAADPGNIVGFEFEMEEQPFVLKDRWAFQQQVPVREAHYTLQLPAGWEYKAVFLNAPEVKPTQSGNQWQWSVGDLKAIKGEEDMPPWDGIAGQMIVSYYPAGGVAAGKTFNDWSQMGSWYTELIRGRTDPSPEIKQQAVSLTASATNQLDKMRALARFVQKDVRYVEIKLGIGGWQPHTAADVFAHRYGDCKDKATLLRAMLDQIGVESYIVLINTERGSVTSETMPHLAFNHAISAIRLPEGLEDTSLYAIYRHPKLGRILFFDPTNEMTPFGQISGKLQENYGLLVMPQGGELVRLPRLPGTMNTLRRTGTLTLTPQGALTGDFEETRVGDHAKEHREMLRSVTKDADRIKPIETMLSHSLSTFQITKAIVVNQNETLQPFQYRYSIVAPDYAKLAGNLVLVRPRVIGSKSSAILDTKEPRQSPVEFDGPEQDTDTFEITLPAGYEVDELPPPVDLNYSFASYHSKTEAAGNKLRYTRTLEIKELSVPVSKVEELKSFYHRIAGDERNTAVLRPAGSSH